MIMHYKLPLNEIVVDFYDILKSLSSGYATFDYEELGFEFSYLVKVRMGCIATYWLLFVIDVVFNNGCFSDYEEEYVLWK